MTIAAEQVRPPGFRPRRHRRPAHRSPVREIALNIAATLGAVCILLTILALLFDVTLIMFKTGSMSPTIPTGSLAVVKQIPASEARVGDVVTVDRPGQLPVTHRVVAIGAANAGADGGSATLTLRGDANTVDDPAPYTVPSVRLVLFAMPGLAYGVVALSNPLAMGLITVVVAGLVTWVFWPRARS